MEVSRLCFPQHALPGLPLSHQNVSAPLPLEATEHVPRPLFSCPAACGFPSPADDHVTAALDLNDLVLRNPPATFFVRASGDSMAPLVDDGDLCVVDRSVEAQPGDLVIAEVDGAFTLKRYAVRGGRRMLVPENDTYAAIHFAPGTEIAFFGVVTHTLKTHGRRR